MNFKIGARCLHTGAIRFMDEANYPAEPINTIKEAIDISVQYAVDVTDETGSGWAWYVEEPQS
jgi:hypothetical protein